MPDHRFEFELAIDQIRLVAPHILGHAGGARVGAGDAVLVEPSRVDDALADGAFLEHGVVEHHVVHVLHGAFDFAQGFFHALLEAIRQAVTHAAGQDEHVVDARTGHFLETVEHQVARVGRPLADHAQAERTGLATEVHQIAVDAAHFQDQRAHPVGALR